jgi:hypothetical protein
LAGTPAFRARQAHPVSRILGRVHRINDLTINGGTLALVHMHRYHPDKWTMTRQMPEVALMTLEFIAAMYVALCVGATIGYVIAGLLANASKH